MAHFNPEEKAPGIQEVGQERLEASNREGAFLESARAVLDGRMKGISVRENGVLRLFNAERTLMYEGYSPGQEHLKGLICRLEHKELRIVTPCFSKFYNLGEKPENDQNFYRLLQHESVVVNFPEKVDGTNIRLYVNPDTQEFGAATRGMIDGGKDEDEEGFGDAANIHFGKEALAIAKEQFPKILDKDLLNRFTPIFELIHPENRIVTNYGDKKDLVLLAVFDKEQGCRELTRQELEEFARQYALHLVETIQVNSRNWDGDLKSLQALWQGTDKEGTVVTVELNGEIIFRIKVKSPEYLQLMRVMKFCTLKRTEELADEWHSTSWETFKEKLHEQHPDLPEEVMMGYENHFRTFERYINFIGQQADGIIVAYNKLVEEYAGKIETQKVFALAIQQKPDKSFFFLLRKFGAKKLSECRMKMVEQLRKRLSLKDFSEQET